MAATAAAIHRAGGPLRFVAFASSRSRSLLHLLTPARVISSSHAYHPFVAAVVPSQGHPHPPPQQWGPPPPKWSPQGHPPPPTVSNCYQQPHQAPPPPSRNDYQPQRQGPPPPPPRHSYGPPPPAPPPPPQQHLDPIPLWSNHYQQRQGPPAPPAPQRQVDRAVQGGAGEGGDGAAREGGARRRGVLLRARRRLLHAQAAGGAPQGARLSAPLMTTASPPAVAEMHQQCIDTWHKSHSNCPLCRSNITFVVVEVAPPEPEGRAPGDANRNTHEVVVVIDDFEDMCEEQQDPVSIGGVRADRDDRETEDSREGAEEEANGMAGIREEGVHHDSRMSIAEVLQSSMEDELIAARERRLLTGGGESLIQTIQC